MHLSVVPMQPLERVIKRIIVAGIHANRRFASSGSHPKAFCA